MDGRGNVRNNPAFDNNRTWQASSHPVPRVAFRPMANQVPQLVNPNLHRSSSDKPFRLDASALLIAVNQGFIRTMVVVTTLWRESKHLRKLDMSRQQHCSICTRGPSQDPLRTFCSSGLRVRNVMLRKTATGTWLSAWVPESTVTLSVFLMFCSMVQSSVEFILAVDFALQCLLT